MRLFQIKHEVTGKVTGLKREWWADIATAIILIWLQKGNRQMAKYRKKPVVIEAIKWTGKNLFDVICFTDGHPETSYAAANDGWDSYCNLVDREGFKIKTLEGWMNADIGDWIIMGIKGELYPCKPDIFEQTYEQVIERKQE